MSERFDCCQSNVGEKRHRNLNCLSSLTLCHDREEREREKHSLGGRNGEEHFSGLGGKDALQTAWFWGKFLHFLAALCPASRDDIVPLHRRIGFSFLHQD